MESRSDHDMTLAGTAARLKASIAWLRDGKPTEIGGIGVADMEAMLPIIEATRARPQSAAWGMVLVPREPTREMLNTWALKMPAAVFTQPEAKNRVLGWSAVSEIWRDMIAAAPSATADAKTMTPVSTSGWLEAMPARGPTTLQWDDAPQVDKSADLQGQQVDETADLHPLTRDLVARFARALAEKLAAAEKKYGFSDGWADPDWMEDCRAGLREHVDKGDPRDVAAYCAFLWHHGASTNVPAPDAEPEKVSVAECIAQLDRWAGHLEAAIDRQAHEHLGQHANDEPPAGSRDPMEQFP